MQNVQRSLVSWVTDVHDFPSAHLLKCKTPNQASGPDLQVAKRQVMTVNFNGQQERCIAQALKPYLIKV